jgi:hypothetical protein
MRPAPSVTLGACALFVVAGCFGGGGDSQRYSLAPSKDCFAARGDAVRRLSDPIAEASGGWLEINPGNATWIGFTENESEAKRIKRKIEGDLPIPFRQEAVTKGNAVYYASRSTMPQDMRENIEACLK